MVRTEPFFRKCCFCIPLQSCLQIWAVMKVITDIGVSLFLLMLGLLVSNNQLRLSFKEFTLEDSLCLGVLILLIDAVAMMVLSVGLCKNDVPSLNIFFYYSIYMVIAGATFVIGISIYGAVNWYMDTDGVLYISLTICGIVNTCLDVVIILTLKSEIIKLRTKQQFEFVTFKEEGRAENDQIEEEKLTV